MKLVLSFCILLLSTLGYTASNFAGISFHSSIDNNQSILLKNDLKYLFNSNYSLSNPDFMSVTGISKTQGPELFNFLANRIRSIVGENFKMSETSFFQRSDFAFPKTPLPDLTSVAESAQPFFESREQISMTNIGAALYIGGKSAKKLLGIELDGTRVYATSPRIGILQIGEGLFHPDMLVNQNISATSNSISRLATLFHESRHSDGTGIDTGFIHVRCPKEHDFENLAVCDKNSNGPYTVGALAEKILLQNCINCSEIEKTQLEANIIDSLSRVIKFTQSQQIDDLRQLLAVYKETLELYEQMYLSATGEHANSIKEETSKLSLKVSSLEERLIVALNTTTTPTPVLGDATPEGQFGNISIKTSSRSMRRSLGGRR